MILIVCEGIGTEPIYFNGLKTAFKLSTVEVAVEGIGGTPITVVDRGIARRDEQQARSRRANQAIVAPFDEVWCVFDTEYPPHNPSFPAAVDKARAHGLSLAVTNPSFEFWFLLHFRDTTKVFTSNAELRADLGIHLPGDGKTRDYTPDLLDKTDAAITRAERIQTLYCSENDPYPHPSTGVHLLAKVLTAMMRLPS